MADIIPININNMDSAETSNMMSEVLLNLRTEPIPMERAISMPIAKLSTLGAGMTSLQPVLNSVTQTTSPSSTKLYQLANESVGDMLKTAKNGNFWAAFKTADGKSKFAQLKPADAVSVTNKIEMRLNPAMLMMAVALFSIEKELGTMVEMEKQILSFLEFEKEAEIEADVITLNEMITKYKHNWDNEQFLSSSHKMVSDIQRTARKNMISYQKIVKEALEKKKLIVAQGQVHTMLQGLKRKFEYYRLSLYTFSLASLLEIILSGNYKEANISNSISEIRKHSDEYRTIFGECSLFLERLAKRAIDTKVLKGVGGASDAFGRLIGNIPKIKDGQADEFFQEKGERLMQNAEENINDVVSLFAKIGNPNTGILIRKMEDIIQIYDRTTEICFDKDNIYLIAS